MCLALAVHHSTRFNRLAAHGEGWWCQSAIIEELLPCENSDWCHLRHVSLDSIDIGRK